MPDNAFKVVFLVGLAVYLFGVYGPSMHRYRRMKLSALRSRPLDMLLDFSTYIFWQVLPLVYALSGWLDFANYNLPDTFGWLGAILFAGALVVLWRAYADLGRNWSPKLDIMEGQSLVTHGIYRHIRHPIYAGIWLWAVAHPLLLHNWIAGWGLILLFAPLYLIRVPREERMMLEHFGDEYRKYMIQTGRIFPRRGRR